MLAHCLLPMLLLLLAAVENLQTQKLPPVLTNFFEKYNYNEPDEHYNQTYSIPSGQCWKMLPVREKQEELKCRHPVPGYRYGYLKYNVNVYDYDKVQINSTGNGHPGNEDLTTISRKRPCKGEAVVTVDVWCGVRAP